MYYFNVRIGQNCWQRHHCLCVDILYRMKTCKLWIAACSFFARSAKSRRRLYKTKKKHSEYLSYKNIHEIHKNGDLDHYCFRISPALTTPLNVSECGVQSTSDPMQCLFTAFQENKRTSIQGYQSIWILVITYIRWRKLFYLPVF